MMGGFFALPFLTYLPIQPPTAALFLKYTSHVIGLSKRLIFSLSTPFSPFLTPPASAQLDPQKGRVYDCQIWLEGDKLILRGSLFGIGRKQVWLPAKDFKGGASSPTPRKPRLK